MSSSTTLVSLDEYLATTYRPDRDYVDSKSWSVTWGNGITAVFRLFF